MTCHKEIIERETEIAKLSLSETITISGTGELFTYLDHHTQKREQQTFMEPNRYPKIFLV